MQLVSIPHPEDVWAGAQAKPFTLCDTLTIADAAMVYRDRHPRPVIWFGEGALNPRKAADLNKIEELIGKGVTDGKGPGTLEAWEASWAVYCALTDGVQKGSVLATKPVYLPNGRINPVLTEIPLSALLDLARQRGDAGEIVSSLLTWYEDSPPEPPAAESPLSTEPAVTTAETAAVEPSSPQRGAYRGALEAWLAERPLATLRRMTPDAIASDFKLYCEEARPWLLLPKRLRSMDRLIEGIVARRVADAKAGTRQNKGRQQPVSAGKRQ